MKESQRFRQWGVTVIAVLASLALGGLVRSAFHLAISSPVFAAKTHETRTGPAATKSITVDGMEVGVLTLNENEVLRLTSTLAGLTPLERVNIVAERVNAAIADSIPPANIQPRQVSGMWTVAAGNQTLITTDAEEARRAGTTPSAQAQAWADILSSGIEKHYAQSGKAGTDQAATVWKPEEPYDDKWVPIVSVLEGLKLGVARVNGPQSKVKQVQAVAQIETHYKDLVEIDVYLPISTNLPGESLAIVQGAAVTGIGDIDL